MLSVLLLGGLGCAPAIAGPAPSVADETLAGQLVLHLRDALAADDSVAIERALAGIEGALSAQGRAALEVDVAAERFLLDRLLSQHAFADPNVVARVADIEAQLHARLALQGSDLVPAEFPPDSQLIFLDLGPFPFRRFSIHLSPDERLLAGVTTPRCDSSLSFLLWDQSHTSLLDYQHSTQGQVLIRAPAAGRAELRVRPLAACPGGLGAWLRRLPAARKIALDNPPMSLPAAGHEILEVPVAADRLSRIRFAGQPLVRYRIRSDNSSPGLDAAVVLWRGEEDELLLDDDDSGGGLDPSLDVWTLADEPYLLQVGSVNGTAGQLDLHIETSPIPALSLGTAVEILFANDNPTLFHLDVEAGATYRISTGDLDAGVDTAILTFRPGDPAVLGADDDGGRERLASSLVLRPEESGNLIIAVFDISEHSNPTSKRHRGSARLVAQQTVGEPIEPARFVALPTEVTACGDHPSPRSTLPTGNSSADREVRTLRASPCASHLSAALR
jgi:hypothetical protein